MRDIVIHKGTAVGSTTTVARIAEVLINGERFDGFHAQHTEPTPPVRHHGPNRKQRRRAAALQRASLR